MYYDFETELEMLVKEAVAMGIPGSRMCFLSKRVLNTFQRMKNQNEKLREDNIDLLRVLKDGKVVS